jgi:hypothetical protein
VIRALLGIVGVLAVMVAGALTAPARADELPPLIMVREASVDGDARFGRTLEADPGRWRPAPTRIRYQWVCDGRPIRVADRRRYEIRPADVGHRVGVIVTARAPGRAPTTDFAPAGRVQHRVGVRRTVRYSVRTKGDVSVIVREFRRLAQQTYDDPRGWRGKGVRFVRVPKGGKFTLWISVAHLVPSFSSGCSAEWSCRVGRDVIINQTRWRNASPAWNAGGRSLRDYRHMVVNHETGHWLGYGHATCPRRGAPAPVMMQQSKGTGGCRFNPWPTVAELRR